MKAVQRAMGYGGDSTEECKKLSEKYLRKISRDSARLIERKGAARALRIFQTRHNDLIQRAQVRVE